MAFESLPANLARVREEISRVQRQEGLEGDVKIVAVTKGHSAEAATAAVQAGLVEMGENRVQEGVGKIDELGELPATWHLIGHLQTNKAKHVPGRFAWVHSVDSVRVAEALQGAMEQRAPAQRLRVLVQVNVSGEPQKSGCVPEAAGEIAQRVAEAPALQVEGLMTMAPFVDDERLQRRAFAELRAVRERIEGAGLGLPELSMGMSGDYRAAVAEGATILRLGTVLFGERQK
jgi:pyridoxal phosphate enzyme (YggS family)